MNKLLISDKKRKVYKRPSYISYMKFKRRILTAIVPLLLSGNSQILSQPQSEIIPPWSEIRYETINENIPNRIVRKENLEGLLNFVTPDDPAIKEFNSKIDYKNKNNIEIARLVFSELGQYGVEVKYNQHEREIYDKQSQWHLIPSYVVTPSDKVEGIQYPKETLQFRGGSNKNLNLLYASLLENLNIETALLSHDDLNMIHMMFDSNMSKEEIKRQYNIEDWMRIDYNNKVWIPITAQSVGLHFMYAWRVGAGQYKIIEFSGGECIELNSRIIHKPK